MISNFNYFFEVHKESDRASKDGSPVSICKRSSFNAEQVELAEDHVLVQVELCLLTSRNFYRMYSGCADQSKNAILPVSNCVYGAVRKIGSSVENLHVGDSVISFIDNTLDGASSSGLCRYCLVDQYCTVIKPLDISPADFLVNFPDMLQIEIMTQFIPRYPIKNTFLITNGASPTSLNMINFYKKYNVKLIVLVENSAQDALVKQHFSDCTVIDLSLFPSNFVERVMLETFDLGVSGILHIGDGANDFWSSAEFCQALARTASFNSTIIYNSDWLLCKGDVDKHFLRFMSALQSKSVTVQFFNFNSTICCGAFTNQFFDSAKSAIGKIVNKENIVVERQIVSERAQLEDLLNDHEQVLGTKKIIINVARF